MVFVRITESEKKALHEIIQKLHERILDILYMTSSRKTAALIKFVLGFHFHLITCWCPILFIDLWNYCKSYFMNKGICNDDRIILIENGKIWNKNLDISETFNNYFVNIIKDLGIFDWADDSSDRSDLFTWISSFSDHPSNQMIKDKYQNSFSFKFWTCYYWSSLKIYWWNWL